LDANFKVDDAAAIMKVKGPDGKFALEGTDNWFSMSLFNYDISDTKMKKILDLLDYLLGDEGTKLAVYGKAGYDYTEDADGALPCRRMVGRSVTMANTSPRPTGPNISVTSPPLATITPSRIR
jgi:hypothetical protein